MKKPMRCSGLNAVSHRSLGADIAHKVLVGICVEAAAVDVEVEIAAPGAAHRTSDQISSAGVISKLP